MSRQSDAYRALPAIEKLLNREELSGFTSVAELAVVKQEARNQVEQLRSRIALNDPEIIAWVIESDVQKEICQKIIVSLTDRSPGTLKAVFNLTGTVIHTNLGRARLPVEAVAAMEVAALGDVNIEYDLESGRRGDRDAHLEKLLADLTGAEAATVVNNNAAAVMLVLNSLAKGQNVVISRGELVEIGGAFRIPDVMESASCCLREVGTTNRTHLADYEKAIDEKAAMIMRVHASNYHIQGFTADVADAALSKLAVASGIPFVSDLGSGTLIELTQYGLPKEPTVAGTLAAGADLVTFSGDKLLGGPQSGIVAGRKDLIEKLKSNPLKRALRIDKITMAALVAVLELYRQPDLLKSRLPLLRDLTRPANEIETVCRRLLPLLSDRVAGRATVDVVPCKSQIGSGSLPMDLLDSFALCVDPIAERGKRDAALLNLARQFRMLPRPVVGRISDGRYLLDMRCLRDEHEFVDQLSALNVH